MKKRKDVSVLLKYRAIPLGSNRERDIGGMSGVSSVGVESGIITLFPQHRQAAWKRQVFPSPLKGCHFGYWVSLFCFPSWSSVPVVAG